MVDQQAWDRPRPHRAETLADADGNGAGRHRGTVGWADRPGDATGEAAGVRPSPDAWTAWQARQNGAFAPSRYNGTPDQRGYPPARHGREPDHPAEPSAEQPAAPPRGRLDKSRWHWLLFVPVVVPLLTPLYNRVEPTLGGVPFFYWGQLSFALLASAVIAIVHLATKPRDW